MSIIYLLNHVSVGIFGMVLSASFCDIVWTRKKNFFICSMIVLLIFQGIIYFFVDPYLARCLYPITTHVPLAIILCFLSKKKLWSAISVLTAYLCCQIRRWIALLVAAIFLGDPVIESLTELVVTLPLLLLLVHFVSPHMRSFSHYVISIQCQFGWIPVLYYGFDYLTAVYTDLLVEGSIVAVEFMPFVCCAAYLVFAIHISAAEQARSRLEQIQGELNIQIAQAVREIETLRKSQKNAVVYRHDLHHHMQYLSSCLANGRIERAQMYIREICLKIEEDKITAFCKNEAANLIFSFFAGRANNQGISMKIKAVLSENLPVPESDLCVLLSNALENALHACQKRKERGLSGMIEVSAYDQDGEFFLQIINSCDEDITFAHGIPVTDSPGHGMGVRSICAIVERYGGIYTFRVEDGCFALRLKI